MEQEIKLTVRLPDDLKQWLATRAANNLRSMNAELLAILKDAKDGKDQHKAASKSKVKQ